MNKGFRHIKKFNIWGKRNFYKTRLLSIGILAVNLPLIFYILYLIFYAHSFLSGDIFTIIFIGTIAGVFLLYRHIDSVKQSILLVTKSLNVYFNQGEIPEFTPSHYQEINQLYKAIKFAIQSNEQKILDLENIILSHREESLQIVLERETAEIHLRQCLSIANRHHLPLCVALISVEDSTLTENSDFLATPSSQIIHLMQELKQILRESDWVAHWKKDEFLLAIFSELPGTKIALNRILDRLVNQEESLENNCSTQCSIYIGYTKAQPNEHYRACIDRINQALQQAKITGERCVFFEGIGNRQ
ncbi:hypothetical protein PL11201_450067 [Planktothrix sp. PCC 11201]|uniref:diguanylate cyclase domain-containing protein n=1 Tax=Planktothrix sp. PCC 11201 TaxID=1729650 RepID=UPI00091EB72C|nr:diguanylate cyclase [Planktothrix sp. PCC 11201]SKB12908.1 hypothetical protein PL11201_450067 [Planktothrix sp. PCC 11201]